MFYAMLSEGNLKRKTIGTVAGRRVKERSQKEKIELKKVRRTLPWLVLSSHKYESTNTLGYITRT
jgi:hypothetical protein